MNQNKSFLQQFVSEIPIKSIGKLSICPHPTSHTLLFYPIKQKNPEDLTYLAQKTQKTQKIGVFRPFLKIWKSVSFKIDFCIIFIHTLRKKLKKIRYPYFPHILPPSIHIGPSMFKKCLKWAIRNKILHSLK